MLRLLKERSRRILLLRSLELLKLTGLKLYRNLLRRAFKFQIYINLSINNINKKILYPQIIQLFGKRPIKRIL